MRRIRTMQTVEEETKIIAKTKARKSRRCATKKGNDAAPAPEATDAPTNLTDALVEATEEAVATVEEMVESATASIKAVFEPATATPQDKSPSRVRAAKPRAQKKPLVVPQVVVR